MRATATPADKSAAPPLRAARRGRVPGALVLAAWQVGLVWRLLALVWAALLASALLVSVMPLFAYVASSVSLRDSLQADPLNRDLNIVTALTGVDSPLYSEVDASYGTILRQHIGRLLPAPPVRSVLIQDLSLQGSQDVLNIIGVDVPQFQPHLLTAAACAPPAADPACAGQALEGRLPATQSDELEVALLPDAAAALRVHTSDMLTLSLPGFPTIGFGGFGGPRLPVPIRVVGTVLPRAEGGTFWRYHPLASQASVDGHNYTVLASKAALLALADRLGTPQFGVHLGANAQWLYEVDASHLTINQLDDMIARFDTLQARLGEGYYSPRLRDLEIESRLIGPEGLLAANRDRAATARIPLAFFLAGTVVVAVFFAALLTELLLERQSGAILQMRGRGFGRSAIFGAVALQLLLVSALALVGALALAPLAARAIGQRVLASGDQPALALLAGDQGRLLSTFWGYSAIVIGCAALAMLLGTAGVIRQNVLVARQEAGRPMEPPLWQRLRLDLFAALLALAGVLLALFVDAQGASFDAGTQRLLTPLLLAWPLLLVATALLLALRGVTWVLRAATWLAARLRGALGLLALAQLSRAPRQALRMVMLLAIALALSLFITVFAASQAERPDDLASFQTGADFTGTLPAHTLIPNEPDQPLPRLAYDLQYLTTRYSGVRGVRSATAGYVDDAAPANLRVSQPVTLLALDADTYTRTAVWPARSDVSALLARLAALRTDRMTFGDAPTVPAIVDDALWNAFHLDESPAFRLIFTTTPSGVPIRYLAIGHVPSVPRTVAGHSGVLVDYLTFARVQLALGGQHPNLAPNTLWLRTADAPAQLAATRAALAGATWHLDGLLDRRALLADLRQQPLPLAVLGVAVLGALMPLALATVGVLAASWLQMRRRLAGFGLLRALGMTPRQLTRLLLGEQVLIYLAATALGIAFGLFLAETLALRLIFSLVPFSATSESAAVASFFSLQNNPPLRLILPPAAWWLVGGVVALNLLALGAMALLLTRDRIGQTLRFDEDA
jgi:hypothetical protein